MQITADDKFQPPIELQLWVGGVPSRQIEISFGGVTRKATKGLSIVDDRVVPKTCSRETPVVTDRGAEITMKTFLSAPKNSTRP